MLFPLSQNIWKKVQQNRLAQLYDTDNDFAVYMRMISALAFVDIPDVGRSVLRLAQLRGLG